MSSTAMTRPTLNTTTQANATVGLATTAQGTTGTTMNSTVMTEPTQNTTTQVMNSASLSTVLPIVAIVVVCVVLLVVGVAMGCVCHYIMYARKWKRLVLEQGARSP